MPPLDNLLLLRHVCLACVSTVGMKRDPRTSSLTNKRAFNTVLFRKCLEREEREGSVCEARTTSGAQVRRVQARPNLAEATHFYPARASLASSGDKSSQRSCYLGNFIARLSNLSHSQDLCVTMTRKRDKEQTAIDRSETKKSDWRFQVQMGDKSGVFQS